MMAPQDDLTEMEERRCGTCQYWKETRPYELGSMWPYSLGIATSQYHTFFNKVKHSAMLGRIVKHGATRRPDR